MDEMDGMDDMDDMDTRKNDYDIRKSNRRGWGKGLRWAGIPVLLLCAGNAFASESAPGGPAPGWIWTLPFLVLLLSIALCPLIPRVAHVWEHNRTKFLLSVALSAVVCAYYALRGYGFAGAAPGVASVALTLKHALVADYVPFIILLFSLFTISGGIRLSGDIPAHPLTNTLFLGIGAIFASLIGTTGASVLLIRPLLQVNSERKHVKHTVIFFIFLVSNIGGCLLPLGDPPLLLGFLRGVPFLWTLHLFPMYALAVALLLALYFAVDLFAYRHERSRDLQVDETDYVPIRLEGAGNLLLLGGVLLAVALLVPGQRIPLTPWAVPDLWLREIALLGLSALSYTLTPKRIHGENHFAFGPILEVAALFVGVFVTMQIPIEILRAKGAALGIATPMAFFWASGGLSSFLDNAPTYVVFFELAGSLPAAGQRLVPHVATATGSIPFADLLAISCASVFMGANTYIGNGPNFLVKSIAEHRGVKMPGFFGYMLYSGAILIPLFALVSLVFFR